MTIKNPARKGLSSKVYWMCYPKPTTISEIARRLSIPKKTPKRKNRIETSHFYGARDLLLDKEYLIKLPNGLLSTPKALVDGIEQALQEKKEILTEDDRAVLLRVLGSQDFRKMMDIKSMDDDIAEDSTFDAVEALMVYFCSSAFSFYVARSQASFISKRWKLRGFPKGSGNIFKKFLKNLHKKYKEPMDHSGLDEVDGISWDFVFNFDFSTPLFDAIPMDLLKKLSLLIPEPLLAAFPIIVKDIFGEMRDNFWVRKKE